MTVNLHELELKIGEKAAKDKDFMKKLKTDPHSVIEKEGKITLPKDIVVKLHLAEPDTLYIELPPEKVKLKGQSSDLAKIYEEMYRLEKKSSLAPEEIFDHLQRSLAIKADQDKKFRKKLLNSPTEVVEELLGKDLIGGVKVNVFESSMNQLHFTVPINLSELSENSLEKVSGGLQTSQLPRAHGVSGISDPSKQDPSIPVKIGMLAKKVLDLF